MPATPQSNPRRLAAHLRRAARAAGYDLDQPRSGATKEIAARSGVPQSSVSRIFAGELIPKVGTFQALADALDLDVVELLTVAGLITPRTDAPKPPLATPYTPEDAARLLELDDADVPLFVDFVNRLQSSSPHPRG